MLALLGVLDNLKTYTYYNCKTGKELFTCQVVNVLCADRAFHAATGLHRDKQSPIYVWCDKWTDPTAMYSE